MKRTLTIMTRAFAACLALALMLAAAGCGANAEQTAQGFLEELFTCTAEQAAELEPIAFTRDDADGKLAEYFRSRLGDRMTEDAFEDAMQNRYVTRAFSLTVEGAPSVSASVTLTKRSDGEIYDYTAELTSDGAVAASAFGTVIMIKEDGAWKVSALKLSFRSKL